MNKFILFFMVSGLGLALSGCASLPEVQGPQASPSAPQGVRVSFGARDRVAIGDRVDFYTLNCRTRKFGSQGPTDSCRQFSVGDGRVTDVLGSGESIVQPDPGVRAERGVFAQKKGR